MKTKINFILIALCLVFFCFSTDSYAAYFYGYDLTNEEVIDLLPEEYQNNYTQVLRSDFNVTVYDTDYIVLSSSNSSLISRGNELVTYLNNNETEYLYSFNYLGFDYTVFYINFIGSETQYPITDNMKIEKFDLTKSSGSYTRTLYSRNWVSSTVDILNEDGTIFFQGTPTVQPPTQGGALVPVELEELEEKITGTMGTITIVAVSCLALLILLPLFLKVLYKFL